MANVLCMLMLLGSLMAIQAARPIILDAEIPKSKTKAFDIKSVNWEEVIAGSKNLIEEARENERQIDQFMKSISDEDLKRCQEAFCVSALQTHNEIRAKHGLENMVIDPSFRMQAQMKANAFATGDIKSVIKMDFDTQSDWFGGLVGVFWSPWWRDSIDFTCSDMGKEITKRFYKPLQYKEFRSNKIGCGIAPRTVGKYVDAYIRYGRKMNS